MVESLFVLSIIILLTGLSIPYIHRINLDQPFAETLKIYDAQCEAMVTKSKSAYDTITFNSEGNINHATTIEHSHYAIVFQLGCGRFYVRE